MEIEPPSSDSAPQDHQKRRDIQGLRALAVGTVVLNHAHIPGFAGGFVGVDVFFVISGFLITGVLLGDVSKYSRVRFLNFYARRARRILPAATVTILVTGIASVLLLSIIQARSELVDGLWAGFFAANIHLAQVGTNYFSVSSAPSPLEHFWSLAVEEQFYLVWPALLGATVWLMHKRVSAHAFRLSVGGLLAVVTGLSLWASVSQTASNPTAAYFSTFSRAWELAIGALLAVALPYLKRINNGLLEAISWMGLGAITLSVGLFNASTPFPGVAALLPVLGAAGVLVGGVGSLGWGVHRILSLKAFNFIGDISYSLYLWHFPLLVLGAAYLGRADTLWARVGLIGAAVVVSSITYYGLENPVRKAKVLATKAWRSMVLWPIASGAIVLLASVAAPTGGFVGAVGPSNSSLGVPVAVAQAVEAAQAGEAVPTATSPSLLNADQAHVSLGGCDAYDTPNWHLCQMGDPSGHQSVVVFGNSHGAMWAPAIAEAAKAAHWRFYPVVREACGFEIYVDLGGKWGSHNICSTWYATAKADIAKIHPDVLVIGTYTDTPQWYEGEKVIISQLSALAKKVIILSDTTKIPNPSGCLLTSGATQKSCLATVSPTRSADTTRTSSLARLSGAQFIDVTPWFCDAGLCPSLINGIVPFTDGSHLTVEYSKYLGTAMAQALNLGGSVVQPQSVPLSGPGTTTITTTS